VRRLQQLVKNQTRSKNHINSFLKLHDLKRPADIKIRWTKKHLAWLASITFDQPAHEFTFKQLLGSYCNVRNEIMEALRFLRKLSREPRYSENYKIVTSVKGVGLITGMTFLLELSDISRFSNVNKLSSFIGLTPSQFSSGDHVRLGHITREGNDHLRRVLVESCWTVIRFDPILKEKYNRLRARGVNGKKAIVAVARTLAVRLRRCLLDKTPYVIGVN
jgi:transposase